MKRSILFGICAFFIGLFSTTTFAGVFPVSTAETTASCGLVHSYTDPQFCSEFKTVTLCYCDAKFPSKLWPVFCPSVTKVYSQAIALYKTLPRMCQQAVNNGQSSSVPECENQWTCAMTGKTYTGGACPANPGGNSPCGNIN